MVSDARCAACGCQLARCRAPGCTLSPLGRTPTVHTGFHVANRPEAVGDRPIAGGGGGALGGAAAWHAQQCGHARPGAAADTAAKSHGPVLRQGEQGSRFRFPPPLYYLPSDA
eukprot:365661-Chlamydomonas_euryale.AAC.37